jgi:O-acetyl-ADP-ribose deacetylase
LTKVTVENAQLSIVQGDITEQGTDAIVNAANSSLLGGGGVDGAIHRKGGPTILSECEQIRRTLWKEGLPAGEAVITGGGKLPARYVIHTVGPVWQGGNNNEAKVLTKCYLNSLELANSKSLKSLAFPAISTGVFGYPIQSAGRLALKTVKEYFSKHDKTTTLREVIFVLYTPSDLKVYEELVKAIF